MTRVGKPIKPTHSLKNFTTGYFTSTRFYLVPIPEDQHIIANDWANGWLLPQGNSHLIIVYRPQLLQFIGFSLLLFLPLLIFLHPRYKD